MSQQAKDWPIHAGHEYYKFNGEIFHSALCAKCLPPYKDKVEFWAYGDGDGSPESLAKAVKGYMALPCIQSIKKTDR